jgi:cation:H+ antiporter
MVNFSAFRGRGDTLEAEMDSELIEHEMSLKAGIIWLIIGLVLLIASSRLLVWGAVGCCKLNLELVI